MELTKLVDKAGGELVQDCECGEGKEIDTLEGCPDRGNYHVQ